MFNETGWQNVGYASYIVARNYTEKVGLIDWKIGKKRKRRTKERGKKKKKKRKKKQTSGIRYVHHLLASNSPKTSILP